MIDSLLFLNFAAILLLAALLSLYNLRQARALERASSALEDWVMLQLRRHREAKARETLVADPLAWAASQLKHEIAEPLDLVATHRVDAALQSVELLARDGRRVVIAPLDAATLRRAQQPGRSRLAQALGAPWLNGQRLILSAERSLLNGSDYFDLEAEQAGRHFTVDWSEARRLWFHVLAPRGDNVAQQNKLMPMVANRHPAEFTPHSRRRVTEITSRYDESRLKS